MLHSPSSPWLRHIIHSRSVDVSRSATQFYRAARAGRFVRLAKGIYLPTPVWDALPDDDRFLARIHAAYLVSRDDIVFSHLSAAALWRLPIVGAWPERAEAIVGTEASGATRRAFIARQYPLPERTALIDGIRVTELPRTLIDVARTSPLSVSVAMLDRALAGDSPVSRADLYQEIDDAGRRGIVRARQAVALADPLSGSPGESVSRVGMFLLGLPAPELQHEFVDARGRMIVDFWWPEFGLIGEFDGAGKYLRDEWREGRSTEEVLLAEKQREDRLRALGPRVTRWGWDVASRLPLLEAHLRGAGLR